MLSAISSLSRPRHPSGSTRCTSLALREVWLLSLELLLGQNSVFERMEFAQIFRELHRGLLPFSVTKHGRGRRAFGEVEAVTEGDALEVDWMLSQSMSALAVTGSWPL